MNTQILDNFLQEVKTLPRMFYNTVENFGQRPALKYKVDGTYVTMTYTEFAGIVEIMANGLLSLGLKKGDRVCLMAHTSAQWAWADFSILNSGGVTVTAYPTLPADEVEYLLGHSEFRFMYVGNEEILLRIRSVVEKNPIVEKIIVLDDAFQNETNKIISINTLKNLGKKYAGANPGFYEKNWQSLEGSDPSSIIYTSGTTGSFLKGSLLTHVDMIGSLTRSLKHMIIGGTNCTYEDTAFSLLPLSHIWERNNSYFAMIAVGGCIGFAEKPTTLLQDIAEIKPTWVLLVPRLWDRIFNGLKGALTSTPEAKANFDWAMEVGRKVLKHRTKPNGAVDLTADPTEGLDDDLKADFLKAKASVFDVYYNILGGRLKVAYSGGGMLPPDLHEAFLSINFPLLNGWGLTETAAGINHGYPNATKIGWLSKMVPGVEAKLDDDGEILVKGIGVITKYYKNPEEDAISFTPDGWFRTGDIGEFDDEGFLRIVDRKKYIIVLDTGKNVAPARIESRFVNNPVVEQIIVVGNDRKYLTGIIVPGYDYILYLMRERGVSFDESKLVYENINGMNTCVQVGPDVANHPMVRELVDIEIEKVNSGLDGYERIKKYIILPHKFTETNGMLTPTLKIKNRVVFVKYAVEIQAMYK